MLVKEIEELRERLNEMMTGEEYGYHEILNVSQQLDILIVKYLRENLDPAI